MKVNKLTALLCIVLFNVGLTFAGDKTGDTSTVVRDPKKYYLKINAIIRDSKGPDKADEKTVKGAIIKVLNENNYLVASYFTDKKGKSNFQLPLDKKYKVLISKKGYVNKIIEIDANVPKDINNAYVFPVDIAIFEEVKNLNTEVLNKPIARVVFNKMQKDFVYDITYTHKVNGELKKMYKEFYSLKREAEKKKKAD